MIQPDPVDCWGRPLPAALAEVQEEDVAAWLRDPLPDDPCPECGGSLDILDRCPECWGFED